MTAPILQFGTSRFLQAHVDLFVSEALDAGQALGGITVVQTTANPASAARVAALAGGAGYPVRIRGLRDGAPFDQTVTCHAVQRALQADADWEQLRDLMATDVQVVVSNTADQGYLLDPRDDARLIQQPSRVPRSFPAKLVALLLGRWLRQPQAPLSLFPCELIERNGDTLCATVCALARQWALPTAFVDWLRTHCVWANSLVDRIVSEALDPVGAVAEPYALWAIERRPGLVLPCTHPSIVLTDELDHHERLKLFLLNAGHTFLAERWREDAHPADMTVAQAMEDARLRPELEALWHDEIVPVFAALDKRDAAEAYLVLLRERLLNPYLAHRLADIAQNHAQKKQRRLAPIVALAHQLGLHLTQPRLNAALANPN
ncbi:mannitol dehydrogenase family protein [Ralstonia mannitolilytica]|uniref:mannitol dehydrogenase family protein n=1 Tax=Ralstonia mannitolilytica TaxID=105219 RepID=UPI0028F4D9D8|nr:mannitol dehydrogenase family protein [Ralstonia mannitolilytica]CAJ0740335.1 Altronate oxidoreductase [Ralstonia mannitolilytica]